MALPYSFVTILMGTARILAIVEMHGAKFLQAHDAIELLEHAIQVSDDILAAIPHVSCIEALANVVG